MTPHAKHTYTLIFINDAKMKGHYFESAFNDEDICNLPKGCKVIMPLCERESWFTFNAKSVSDDVSLKKLVDQEEQQESMERVMEVIKTEISSIGDASKVFLGGFGQGGCLAIGIYLKLKA